MSFQVEVLELSYDIIQSCPSCAVLFFRFTHRILQKDPDHGL